MDLFGSRDTLDLGSSHIGYHRLDRLEKSGLVASLDRLPRSIKVLLEFKADINALPNSIDGK